MGRDITKKQRKALLKAQQGEADAVMMYKRLARKVSGVNDALAFIRLAGDEKRHEDICAALTGETVRPNPAKAIMVPAMYRILGKEKTYNIIAKAEYDAAKDYEHLIPDFPELEEVRGDEVHHGDAVSRLLG